MLEQIELVWVFWWRSRRRGQGLGWLVRWRRLRRSGGRRRHRSAAFRQIQQKIKHELRHIGRTVFTHPFYVRLRGIPERLKQLDHGLRHAARQFRQEAAEVRQISILLLVLCSDPGLGQRGTGRMVEAAQPTEVFVTRERFLPLERPSLTYE